MSVAISYLVRRSEALGEVGNWNSKIRTQSRRIPTSDFGFRFLQGARLSTAPCILLSSMWRMPVGYVVRSTNATEADNFFLMSATIIFDRGVYARRRR